MLGSGCERKYLPDLQSLRLLLDAYAEHTLQNMNRGCTIRMMLFHYRTGIHGDEEDAKIIGFDEEL